MSKNRINIYASAGLNKKILKKQYKFEQPRKKNWGGGAPCISCVRQIFTLSGSFLRAGTVLSWALTPGLSVSPGSIIQVGSYLGTVISFTQNSPLETLVFIIDDIENAITITSSDIITLPDLIGNVNGNAFTTPGGVGIPRFINGKHSKQQTIAPVFGWRKTIDCCDFLRPTEEIYKDTWSQSKICKTNNQGNSARTQKPIIESGRQRIKWATPHTKVAAGYHQYRHNVRCSSYERSLEKFDVTPALTDGAWSYLDTAGIKINRPVYHKSGCYSCCNCCVRTQAVIFLNQAINTPPTQSFLLGIEITPGASVLTTGMNQQNPPFAWTIQPGVDIEVTGIWYTPSFNPFTGQQIAFSAIVFIRDRDGDCQGASSGNPFVSAYINKDTLVSTAQVTDLDFTEAKCQNVTNLKQTIYKRSNKKFAANGAVSSGGRLERLKLDTIQGSRIQKRISTGNCSQNRCNTNSKQFTQGYRSSKPRFITNPVEGGNKTAGFPPTRWRNPYIARGKAIGNVILQKECNNCK